MPSAFATSVRGLGVWRMFRPSKFPQITEKRSFTLIPRQLVQGRLELAGGEPFDRFRGNDECRSARLGALGERQLQSNGRSPPAVHKEVARDPKEPGPTGGRLPEPAPGLKSPLEGRLNQVVRVGGVAGQPPGKGGDLLQVGKRQIAELLSGHFNSLLPQTAEGAPEFHPSSGGPPFSQSDLIFSESFRR